MKVLYLYFHFVSHLLISSVLLQEAAPRVPPVSALPLLPRAKLQSGRGWASTRALLLPQARRGQGSPGQSDQSDGGQGSEHQSVQ